MALKTTVERNIRVQVGDDDAVSLQLSGSDECPMLIVAAGADASWVGSEAVAGVLDDLRGAVVLLERHLGISPPPEPLAPVIPFRGESLRAVPRHAEAPMIEEGQPTAPPPGLLTSLASRVAAATAIAGNRGPSEATDGAQDERARAAVYGYSLDDEDE